MQLNERSRAILKVLSTRDGWVTSATISANTGMSIRSVKTYVGELNTIHPHLVASSSKGFRVDASELAKITDAPATSVPQTSQERRNYILAKLLLQQDDCSLDDLAIELCISPDTLDEELRRAKAPLSEFDLMLRTGHNRVYISGAEEMKRKMASQLIYSDAHDFLSLRLMRTYLPHYDLAVVCDVIFATLREHHYFMDDYSMMNLVLHIAISMERNRLPASGENQTVSPVDIDVPNDVQAISSLIGDRLEQAFDVRFSDEEKRDFGVLIMTRVIPDSLDDVDFGPEVARLVSLMQTQAKSEFHITITDKEFTVRFALHMKNLLIRLRAGILLRNPQLADVRRNYPFIYDVAVYLANIVTMETGLEMSEDEISYIALHLGVIIEERKTAKLEITAAVLSPQYYFTSMHMANRLAEVFTNDLHIAHIVSDEAELDDLDNIDIIISTVPLTKLYPVPVARISTYLNSQDVVAIATKTEAIRTQRLRERMQTGVRGMFRPELFYPDTPFSSRDETLTALADQLAASGYVDEDFKQKLFEREAISSSAYASIAIPHPLEMRAFTSVVATALFPKGLDWGGRVVNVVFMLAINPRDRLVFKDVFDFVTKALVTDAGPHQLMKAGDYDEFIDTLMKLAQ